MHLLLQMGAVREAKGAKQKCLQIWFIGYINVHVNI